jgi:hypothetical protein
MSSKKHKSVEDVPVKKSGSLGDSTEGLVSLIDDALSFTAGISSALFGEGEVCAEKETPNGCIEYNIGTATKRLKELVGNLAAIKGRL